MDFYLVQFDFTMKQEIKYNNQKNKFNSQEIEFIVKN